MDDAAARVDRDPLDRGRPDVEADEARHATGAGAPSAA
jgi:hypothetical protein